MTRTFRPFLAALITAPLLVGGLVAADASSPQSRPGLPNRVSWHKGARIPAHSGTNCARLVLQLRPGLRNSAGRVIYRTPANMSRAPIVAGFPVFPGAEAAGNDYRFGDPPEISSNSYLKSAVKGYFASAGLQTVISWYGSSLVRCGLRWAGSGTSFDRNGPTEWERTYNDPSYQNLQVEMAFKQGQSAHGTAIEYYAIATVNAPKPARAHLSTPSSMVIGYDPSGDASGNKPLFVSIKNSTDRSSVVSAINSLPLREGVYLCPAEHGWIARLVLGYAGGRTRVVLFDGCAGVDIGRISLAVGQTAWVTVGYAVYHALYRS